MLYTVLSHSTEAVHVNPRRSLYVGETLHVDFYFKRAISLRYQPLYTSLSHDTPTPFLLEGRSYGISLERAWKAKLKNHIYLRTHHNTAI